MLKTISINKNKALFVFVLATVIVYFPSLFNSYSLDDELYALSPLLEKPQWQQFFHNFTIHTFVDKGMAGYDYRPLALNSFLIEYLLFGKHVLWSHFINLVLYLIILYQFFYLLLKFGFDTSLSLFIILLFALHPVHTEIVCNLKCRDELLAFVFMGISFHCALNYVTTAKLYYLLCIPLFFLLALLSKQSVALFFVFIPASLFFMRAGRQKCITVFLLLVASTVVFFLVKKFGLPAQDRKFVFYENPLAVMGLGASDRFMAPLYLSWRYLGLLIYPYPLAYYYGYRYVDVSAAQAIYMILAAIVHLALIALFIKRTRKDRELSFGIFFYLVHLCPLIFFAKAIPGLMGERFLFAVSFGFCIMVATGLRYLSGYLKGRGAISNAVYILILLFYAGTSFQRTKVWENKEALFKHDMPTLKESAKANLLYGALLSEQALQHKDLPKLEKAIAHLEKAVQIVPSYSLAWENLGVLYYFKGDLDRAFQNLDSALKKDATNSKVYFDKGIIYQQLNEKRQAEKNFRLSLSQDPHYIPTYIRLMRLYEENNELEKSYRVGRAGAGFEKKSDAVYSELIRIALAHGDTINAVYFSEKAVAIDPTNISRIQTLEGYFRSKHNIEKADYYHSLGQ